MQVPSEKTHVIPHGLNLAGYPQPGRRSDSGEPVIGYLARVCPEKGLHQLVEAASILADDSEVPPFRVRAAGFLDRAEAAYLDTIIARTETTSLARSFRVRRRIDSRREDRVSRVDST